ncbi:putative ATP synthase F0, A subunit [Ancylostoma ceylanicum]|uniref:Putative ATP synthase F0, A subunit n=1 Tax=Ancylostoma ceylanicum TaxID=53326 RepID=A0A0D6LWG9_9BILA|nr:putative ATP synthase F0, A subunit [Ancylostoma ceylanicum]
MFGDSRPSMVLKRIKWAPLEKPWAELASVAVHCVPCILTAILSSGIFLNFKIVRGVYYLYSPLEARWKAEEAVFGENWASDDNHFYPGKDVLRRRGLYLIVQAKDGGDVLRREHAAQFLETLKWVTSAKFLSSEGKRFSYSDVCLHFQNECFSNTHARLIADVYSKGDQDHFNMTYPLYYTRFATEPIDVSRTLGGVTLNGDRVASAKAWLVLFQLKHHQSKMERLSADFENAVVRAIEAGAAPGPLLDIFYFHSDTFEQELANENKRLTPMFSITFSVLILFSILCTFNLKWISLPSGVFAFSSDASVKVPVIDWVLNHLLCPDTVFNTLHLQPQVDLTTIRTIGIDDSFLMLAAWHETPRHLPVVDRIGASMKHAAVSISITTLTDALAFLIGAIAPLPAVKYFCFYSCAAIIFIFLYCLSMFVACLALQGRLEARSHNSLLMSPVKDLARPEKLTVWDLAFHMGSIIEDVMPEVEYINNNDVKHESNYKLDADKETADRRMWYQRFFEDYYAPFIANRWMVAFSVLLFSCYVAAAAVGSQQVVVGFDLINIVLAESRPRRFLEVRKKFFPEDFSRLDIAVMKPPRMESSGERNAFMKVLQKFESTPCSAGRNSTDFWYFSFKTYMEKLGFGDAWNNVEEDEESFAENLHGFLMANDKFSYDILKDSNGSTKAFRFTTGLTNVSTDELIYHCATWMRGLCDDNPQYGLSTYTPLWNLADQFEIMWPQTIQDLYISIAVMLCVAMLFIPQPLCAPLIGVSIASVALGVLGIMPYLGVNLDATSMITIAMSVGFSVGIIHALLFLPLVLMYAHKTYLACAASHRRSQKKVSPMKEVESGQKF